MIVCGVNFIISRKWFWHAFITQDE